MGTLEASGLSRCPTPTMPVQGSRVERRGVPFTKKRYCNRNLSGMQRASIQQLRCKAAAQPEVATPEDVDSAVEGKPTQPVARGESVARGGASAQPAARGEGAGRVGGSGGSGRNGSAQQRGRGQGEQGYKYQVADLKEGEWYDGKVAGTTSFGAFVNIGAPKAGLLHISQISSSYVASVDEYLKSGDPLRVRIISIDRQKGQFSVTVLDGDEKSGAATERETGGESPDDGGEPSARPARGRGGGRGRGRGEGRGRADGRARGTPALALPPVNIGEEVTGKITRVERYGVFVSLKEGTKDALLPAEGMKELPPGAVMETTFSKGQDITAFVSEIDKSKRTMRLSVFSPEEQQQESNFSQKGASAGDDGGSAESGGATDTLMAAALRAAGWVPKAKAEESPAPAAAPAAATAVEEAPAQQAPKLDTGDEIPTTAEEPQTDVTTAEEAEAALDTAAALTAEASPAEAEAPAAAAALEEPVAAEEPPQAEEADKVPETEAGLTTEPAAAEQPAQAEEADSAQDTAAVTEAPTAEPEAPAAAEEPAAASNGAEVSEAGVQATAAEAAPVTKAAAPAEPAELEKSDEAPLTEEEVQLDPAAFPAASLASEAPAPESMTAANSVEEPKVGDAVETAVPGEREEVVAQSTEKGQSLSPAAVEAEKTASVQPPGEEAPVQETSAIAVEQVVPEEVKIEASGALQPELPKQELGSPSAAATTEPEQAKAAPAAEKRTSSPAPPSASSSSNGASAAAVSATAVKELRDKTGAGMMACKNALKETSGDVDAAVDYLRQKGLAGADKKSGRITTEGLIVEYIHQGSGLGVLMEVNCETDFVARGETFKSLCDDLAMQVAAFGEVVAVSADDIDAGLLAKEREIEMGKEDIQKAPEDRRAMIVEGRIAKTKKKMSLLEQPYMKDNSKTVQTFIKETIAQLGENISVRRFERYVLGEGIQKKSADLAKDVEEQTKKMQEAAAAKATEEEAPPEPTDEEVANIQISAKLVKELRSSSGAGMMACKKALAACGGDVEKAVDYLRKKGLASADKKAGRVASEGVIASYIHSGRLGVMVEVNCETDFVARGEVFQTLASDLAMQLASNNQVTAIAKEDFPAEELERERKIAMEMDDIKSKPDDIKAKIVEGRVAKIAAEKALLEQAFIRDTKKTVGQHIKETIAALGENISVRRFERYLLGEGLEKKADNFADEVAKATSQ